MQGSNIKAIVSLFRETSEAERVVKINDERLEDLPLGHYVTAPLICRGAIYKLLSPCFRETRGKASERVD